MRVFRGHSVPLAVPTVLTIGNFDGVHCGHMALLERLHSLSETKRLLPAVLTFEPHPREFFAPAAAPARLSILREKLEMLSALGMGATMICRFNEALAQLSARDFVQDILVHALSVRHLVIGDDFHFGRGREGDFALLQQLGGEHGFQVEAMREVTVQGERVSSSAVRDALDAGDMERAARLLGRPYIIDGKVVHGNKLGRELGFCTANIYIRHNPVPMTGVFAVEVAGLAAYPLPGVANLGIRPTIGGVRPLLEVHIFDFNKNIYGAHLAVRFLHKLRDEQRFPDIDALKAQIALDAQAARHYFKRMQ